MNRSQVEQIITRRCGSLLIQANFLLTPIGGSDDLNDPLAWALRQCGITPADPTTATDTDLTALASSLTDKYLDLTELRALESAATRYVGVDNAAGGDSRQEDQLRKALQDAISRKRALVERLYSLATAQSLQAGTIGLTFQETFTDA